ncbi:hypothetical protein ABNB59_12005 [Paenibacillus larvae]|uniref:hypothetical protein n=1 Tax=Paenibacillus larvae TaxID=1464 RepID=UPI0001693C7B|nr:hypothetical protein [Paenibacillus larvae]PCK69608.1 hypothetical protein PL1_2956 [Paenibacillus larvae subsp. larvae B-3650]MDR5598907.1 hypothetical protein [Paenibacillus larvae]MDV3433001.1 hypothetical protein [Paenibacillus larvae]MDV3447067.1 hypothetical protein [Paenibacillus larvae]MDV3483894.1 hypothetical protein [Paenibacillus larvae]
MFYLLPVLVSFLFVLILVPGLRAIAFRIGFVLGGIALYIASLTAMILFTRGSALVLTVGTGGTVLMLMGLFDDWFKTKGKDFPVWPRLIIYLIVSAIPVFLVLKL